MPDETQHTQHVRQFLSRCAERNITLNVDKWWFALPDVCFAGFLVTTDGYHIYDSITDAIVKFPTPSSRTDLRSFIGLVNQLSASTPAIAGLLNPLRPLLGQLSWVMLLRRLSCPLRRPTRLCTDASRQGLNWFRPPTGVR